MDEKGDLQGNTHEISFPDEAQRLISKASWDGTLLSETVLYSLRSI